MSNFPAALTAATVSIRVVATLRQVTWSLVKEQVSRIACIEAVMPSGWGQQASLVSALSTFSFDVVSIKVVPEVFSWVDSRVRRLGYMARLFSSGLYSSPSCVECCVDAAVCSACTQVEAHARVLWDFQYCEALDRESIARCVRLSDPAIAT